MSLQDVLHPDNKTAYQEGDRVEFMVDGGEPIYTGTIRGISSSHIIDHWIIQYDLPFLEWPFSCVNIQHTMIRRVGSNEEFLCRRVSW